MGVIAYWNSKWASSCGFGTVKPAATQKKTKIVFQF